LDLLIFTDNPGVRETRLVKEEAINRGLMVESKAPWDISIPDIPQIETGVIYVPSNMFNRGSTFELINRFIILEELGRNVCVINPLMSLLRYSKETLTLKSDFWGYPHPNTLVTENLEMAYEFASSLLDQNKNVVLKPMCRARGVGVIRLSDIRNREDLLQYLAWYSRSYGAGVLYLQEYIENFGYDIRVFIVDGEVVGRMKRSNPMDWRYNSSRGGLAEPFEDKKYDELAIKVSEAMGLNITGVDILPNKDNIPYILEANAYPGYTNLMATTNIPIHKKIVDFFQRLLDR
jgi:RimK family alpha-L-glutamate ligase